MLRFAWSCTASGGAPAVLPAAPHSAVLFLNASSLIGGVSYTFTVAVTSAAPGDTRSATASTVVRRQRRAAS